MNKKVCIGVYLNEETKQLTIDVDEMLDHLGHEKTEENRKLAYKIAHEMVAIHFPKSKPIE